MKKRIIFDIDNTLIPWNPKWMDTIEIALKEYNLKYTEEDIKLISWEL